MTGTEASSGSARPASLGADSASASRAPLPVPGLGMPDPDTADVRGDVEADTREAGDGRFDPRAHAAAVPDDLDVDAARNDDRDGSATGVDVQINDVVVELCARQVELDAADVGADVRFSGELPPARQPQASETRVDLEGLVQPPVGFGRRTEHPGDADLEVHLVDAASGIQLLHELGGSLLVFVAHDLTLVVAGSFSGYLWPTASGRHYERGYR